MLHGTQPDFRLYIHACTVCVSATHHHKARNDQLSIKKLQTEF